MTATTAAPRITVKQQQVLDLLNNSQSVEAIAKRLKISTAGVYGHMRNLRKAGVVLPGESMGNGATAPPAATAPKPKPAPAPAAPGVAAVFVEPAEALSSAIARATGRAAEIEAERNELAQRIELLREEDRMLVEQVQKYEAALSQLAV